MRICIVQDGPVFNNLKQTIEKTKDFLSQAKKEKADLIVFGESWLSGYPVWIDYCKDVSLWDHAPIKQVWAETYENSIDLESQMFHDLSEAIKANQIHAVIGANERISNGKGSSSLYNSIFTFDNNGELVNHHRKLVPTFTEKLVHTHGDGKGLGAVTTPFGKLGSLICWEHWMPMARQAMHDSAEDIHIALWPQVKEMNQVASRQYAFEGRCHVVAVGQIMDKDELPNYLEISDAIELKSDLLMSGGSCIYGPDGGVILEPQQDQRKLITIDLDLKRNLAERMNLSVSGNYQRHDVFKYTVNRKRPTQEE